MNYSSKGKIEQVGLLLLLQTHLSAIDNSSQVIITFYYYVLFLYKQYNIYNILYIYEIVHEISLISVEI